jgi:hypothetical protein
MVTVHGYASPAQAEFFESMDLLWMVVLNHPEQVRRFIHEAEDFVVFSSFCIKKVAYSVGKYPVLHRQDGRSKYFYLVSGDRCARYRGI